MSELDQVNNTTNLMWMFFNGVFVFFMQCGFGMLEVGAVRNKNVKNILIKNLVDVCCSALAFWMFGFALAFGSTDSFIGTKNYFAGHCLNDKYRGGHCEAGYVDWFFQFSFAATAATIVSGAVAERARFAFYMTYALMLTGFVYPTVVHWVWGGGWLDSEGVNDFAGAAVVHMTGGMGGLVGAMILGPRVGRFEGEMFDVKVNNFRSHSILLGGLGVFVLWTGFYGFNLGSTGTLVGNEEVAERVMINTTLSPACSGLVCALFPALYYYYKTNKVVIGVEVVLNGVLGGLVACTAGCNLLSPGSSAVTGIVAGFVYLGTSNFLKQVKIDDPLDAVAVHYFCGLWGVVSVGLFTPENQATQLGHGLFMGGSGALLGWQLVLALAVSVWTAAFCVLMFVPLNMFNLARVPVEVEHVGLDAHHHGGMEMDSPGESRRGKKFRKTPRGLV